MEIRAATEREAEQIVALQSERNGDESGPAVRGLFEREDVGLRRFAVAVTDDGRVAASLCLIPERLQVGAALLGAGQVEYVATHQAHERQGLVRRLMDLVHRWSVDDGHVLELIAGIPYFYRRFGYEYALPFAPIRIRTPGRQPPPPASGLAIRPATTDDIADLRRLQAEARSAADLSLVEGDDTWWRWWIGHRQEPVWHVVATADGRVVGAGSIAPGPPGAEAPLVRAPAGDGPALRALLDHVGAMHERPGVTDPVHPWSHRHPRRYSLYVRIGDPVRFLDALRPELDRRLAESPLRAAAPAGTLVVSTYTSSIRLDVAEGRVTRIEPTGEPGTGTGIDVPPDRLATLLVGRYGASGLAEREDDVAIAPDAAVAADVLFPRLRSDTTLL
jgi:predicted N-acetyltransferase YhbS